MTDTTFTTESVPIKDTVVNLFSDIQTRINDFKADVSGYISNLESSLQSIETAMPEVSKLTELELPNIEELEFDENKPRLDNINWTAFTPSDLQDAEISSKDIAKPQSITLASNYTYTQPDTSIESELINQVSGIDISQPNLSVVAFSAGDYSSQLGDAAAIPIPVFSDPNISGVDSLSLTAINTGITINSITPPTDFQDNVIPSPTISMPEKPAMPTLSAVALPAQPNITMPTAPIFQALSFPEPITLDFGEFTGTLPDFSSVNESTADFSYTESNYSSDIYFELVKKILNDLRNGGTGLDIDVETAIYARALERQRVENERLYRQVESQLSARGFNLPNGAFISNILSVQQEISSKNDQTNMEIMINQAELAQKNTQFIIEKGIQLEGLLRDFFNNQQNRALEAAKTVAVQGLETLKAQVSIFNLKLEAYKADAAVFETNVKAKLSAVEIYKSQMEGVKIEAETQAVQADIYGKQIAAIESSVRVYAAQMEGAKLQMELEALKIEEFKAMTQVYMSQVEAEKIKTEIYNSQISAEDVRARLQLSKVESYKAQSATAQAQAQILIQEKELQIRYNQQLIEKYQADIAKYQADTQYQTALNELESKNYSALVQNASMTNELKFQNAQSAYEKNRNEIAFSSALNDISFRSYAADVEFKKAQIQAVSQIQDAQTRASQISASLEESRMAHDTHQIDIQLKQFGIESDNFRNEMHHEDHKSDLELKKYQARIEKYLAEIKAGDTLNEQELRAFQADATLFSTTMDAYKASLVQAAEEMKTRILYSQTEVDKSSKEIDLIVRGYLGLKELQTKATEGVMNVGAQLVASAMNALNASASMSSTAGTNWSYTKDLTEY